MILKDLCPVFDRVVLNLPKGVEERFKRVDGAYVGVWTEEEIGEDKGFDMAKKSFKVERTGVAESSLREQVEHIRHFIIFCLSQKVKFLTKPQLNAARSEYQNVCGDPVFCDTLENITVITSV